jgi:hypothetical protein
VRVYKIDHNSLWELDTILDQVSLNAGEAKSSTVFPSVLSPAGVFLPFRSRLEGIPTLPGRMYPRRLCEMLP